MKHQEERLLLPCLLRSEFLILNQQLRAQLHIPRLVRAVYVAECCCNGELLADWAQRFVDLVHVLRRRIQLVLGHPRVVHAMLHSARDADLHLQNLIDLFHPPQVLLANRDVLLIGLLGQVQHVAREQGLSTSPEVLLVRLKHSVEPRQQLLRAVVRVQDHRNPVRRRDGPDQASTRHAPQDRRSVVTVVQRLPSHELRSSLRKLNHDR
mmetsp:Transcript_98190/g.262304  ORF Transcript_98190/g.262304 Transcript_98190/m.262304 type:complete len:209 (-) Transcript_98190:210-836(-)